MTTEKLTGAEGDSWTAKTPGSTFQFDLNARTVTRIPGKGASRTVNDQPRPLLEIVHCTVGARGYWLMSPDPNESVLVEHCWPLSSTIQSIDPAPAD